VSHRPFCRASGRAAFARVRLDHSSFTASSISMIGMSSSMRYTSLQALHTSPSCFVVSSRSPLHLGQARISSSSWLTPIVFLLDPFPLASEPLCEWYERAETEHVSRARAVGGRMPDIPRLARFAAHAKRATGEALDRGEHVVDADFRAAADVEHLT